MDTRHAVLAFFDLLVIPLVDQRPREVAIAGLLGVVHRRGGFGLRDVEPLPGQLVLIGVAPLGAPSGAAGLISSSAADVPDRQY